MVRVRPESNELLRMLQKKAMPTVMATGPISCAPTPDLSSLNYDIISFSRDEGEAEEESKIDSDAVMFEGATRNKTGYQSGLSTHEDESLAHSKTVKFADESPIKPFVRRRIDKLSVTENLTSATTPNRRRIGSGTIPSSSGNNHRHHLQTHDMSYMRA